MRPPWEWELMPDAAVQVEALQRSGVLAPRALWVSSPEPKAAATTALLTDAPVRYDDNLREAHRAGGFLDTDEFLQRVLRSFADVGTPAAKGWEPLSDTAARVIHAARAAVEEAAGRSVVLVGHGTALTVLVAALTDTDPDVAAWQGMRFPDHCCLTWPDRIKAPWGRWAP